MLRLNLGSGSQPLPFFTNIDISYGTSVYPLKFPSNFVDEIRASHILEHFGHRECLCVVGEWTRVLKPGGVLKIAVPDFALIATAYLDGNPYEWPIENYLIGGQIDEYDFHKSLWVYDKLHSLMESLGYKDIEQWDSEIEDCASLPISLNLKGIKQ